MPIGLLHLWWRDNRNHLRWDSDHCQLQTLIWCGKVWIKYYIYRSYRFPHHSMINPNITLLICFSYFHLVRNQTEFSRANSWARQVASSSSYNPPHGTYYWLLSFKGVTFFFPHWSKENTTVRTVLCYSWKSWSRFENSFNLAA